MGIVPFGIQNQYNKKILQNGFSVVAEDPQEDCQDSERTKQIIDLEKIKRETARLHGFGAGGFGVLPANYNGETSDNGEKDQSGESI